MNTWTRDGGFDSWPQAVTRVRELETELALAQAARHLLAAGARRWTP